MKGSIYKSYDERRPMNTDARLLREKHYLMLNQIYKLALRDDEIAVYRYLVYLEQRKDRPCHISYKAIGRALGMAESAVRKYMRSLEIKGFIYTEPTSVRLRNDQNLDGNPKYMVCPFADALERYTNLLLAAADNSRAQQEYERRVGAAPQRANLYDGGSGTVRPQNAPCANSLGAKKLDHRKRRSRTCVHRSSKKRRPTHSWTDRDRTARAAAPRRRRSGTSK